MRRLKYNQEAFTIIELLIASAVFSVVILGASAAVIQMSRLYYKGIISSQTQTTARNLIDSISRPIQYEGDAVTSVVLGANGYNVFCVGPDRYTFSDKQQGKDIKHAMWKDKATATAGGCGEGPNLSGSITTGGVNMLSDNMRIHNVTVGKAIYAPEQLWNIEVTIIYGDNDMTDNSVSPPVCKGSTAGSEWCSVVTYKTKVFKRLTK